MTQYYYNKYNAVSNTVYVQDPSGFLYDKTQTINYAPSLGKNYALNASTGQYSISTLWVSSESIAVGAIAYSVGQLGGVNRSLIKFVSSSSVSFANQTVSCTSYTLESISTIVYSQGTLVTSNIIAIDGTYPVNGYYATDGYWYVRGAIINVDQTAPPTPTMSSLSQTSVILSSSTGSMITCNGQTKATGSTWTGLLAGTAYTAYAYKPASTGYNQSPNSGTLNFTTTNYSQSAPLAPTSSSITQTSVVLTSSAGSMITCNSQTKATGSSWTSLSPGTTYSAYAYMPAYTGYDQSPNSGIINFTTTKYTQSAPSTPTASSITTTSTILTSTSGSYIVCHGQTKISGSTWTGLSPNTSYTAYAYKAETSTYYQSSNSSTLNFTTLVSFLAMKINIDGVLKTSSDGWVKIDGVLRDIDSIWIRVNDTLKKL